MSISFKVTEILRFPNALHAAAWYPWILLAMTRIVFSETWGQAARYALLMSFSLFCLFTAGYPYYVIYSVLLVGPYLLLFIVPGNTRPVVRLSKGQWSKGGFFYRDRGFCCPSESVLPIWSKSLT